MGDVIRLREAIATTEPFLATSPHRAVGRLSVVCGRTEAPDGAEFRIVVRAPGAPDLLIASGDWPESDPNEAWAQIIGTWIELIRATLGVAARRVPALTGAPSDPVPPAE